MMAAAGWGAAATGSLLCLCLAPLVAAQKRLGMRQTSPCSYAQEQALETLVNPAPEGFGFEDEGWLCSKRVFPCGTLTGETILNRTNVGRCHEWIDRIDPYQQSHPFIVQFTQGGVGGKCLETKLRVGECWGLQPENGRNYDCLGRCGPGCSHGDCNSWAPSCLIHDVCSYYFASRGGAKDRNCGDEFRKAEHDWRMQCSNAGRGPCELQYYDRKFSSHTWICEPEPTDNTVDLYAFRGSEDRHGKHVVPRWMKEELVLLT